MSTENRRNFFRINSGRECLVSVDGEEVSGVIVDESIGGFRIQLPSPRLLSSVTEIKLIIDDQVIPVRPVSCVRDDKQGIFVGVQHVEGVDGPNVDLYLMRYFVSVGGCCVACSIREAIGDDQQRILMPASNEFVVKNAQLTCLSQDERVKQLQDDAHRAMAAQFYSSMGITVTQLEEIVKYEFFNVCSQKAADPAATSLQNNE